MTAARAGVTSWNLDAQSFAPTPAEPGEQRQTSFSWVSPRHTQRERKRGSYHGQFNDYRGNQGVLFVMSADWWKCTRARTPTHHTHTNACSLSLSLSLFRALARARSPHPLPAPFTHALFLSVSLPTPHPKPSSPRLRTLSVCLSFTINECLSLISPPASSPGKLWIRRLWY